jgi:hypothetical protein
VGDRVIVSGLPGAFAKYEGKTGEIVSFDTVKNKVRLYTL